MKVEYFIIGFFAVAIAYVALVYVLNMVKQKRKNKPKEDGKPKSDSSKTTKPEKSNKTDGGKVELEHEVLTEKPIDLAVKEANIEYQINEAFEKINAEKDEFEKSSQKPARTGRLQVDREGFEAELRASRGSRLRRKTLKSETAEIGHEGPSQRADSSVENAEEHAQTDESLQTIADEINNMSDEAKVILINDILNKKY